MPDMQFELKHFHTSESDEWQKVFHLYWNNPPNGHGPVRILTINTATGHCCGANTINRPSDWLSQGEFNQALKFLRNLGRVNDHSWDMKDFFYFCHELTENVVTRSPYTQRILSYPSRSERGHNIHMHHVKL